MYARTTRFALVLLLASLLSPTSAQDPPQAKAASAGDEPAVLDHVVVLLDASGSMDEQMGDIKKMDAAKKALQEVVSRLPPSTQIGLIVFSAKNMTNDWAYPLGPRNDARLNAAIQQPLPGGKTPLGAYIKKAADRLLEERARCNGYGTYRLLIVTDGEAQDQNLVNQYTPEVLARGITVDAIGVNMRENHTLAKLANSYRRANDAEALKRAVADVFAEVGGQGGDGLSQEVFAQLAPLPAEVAQSMIQALSQTPNEPIGQAPKKPKPANPTPPRPGPPQAHPPASQSPQGPPAAQPGAQSARPPAVPPSPQQPQGLSKPGVPGIAVLAIAVIVVFSAVSRRMRRQ